MSSGFERRGKNVDVTRPQPERSKPNPILSRADAKLQGYNGSFCEVCGSARMRVSGHCNVCEECGSTTGCS